MQYVGMTPKWNVGHSAQLSCFKNSARSFASFSEPYQVLSWTTGSL